MNSEVTFESVSEYPGNVTGTSIVIRMLDGLGYRFRYATQELSREDYRFTPGKGCKTIGETMRHIWWLMDIICRAIFGENDTPAGDVESRRRHTLEMILKLRMHFNSISDTEFSQIKLGVYPFWHIINGPISDALTHTGQINTLRRLAGNPTVESDVFLMKKP